MPHAGSPTPATAPKPIILHLGEPIVHHQELYRRLESDFNFINPPPSDLQRQAFISQLRKGTWGDFSAIMRPFWNTGGEMGRWDKEIIELLPKTVKVYASAGAGYDWVDTHALADHGILYCNARGASTEAVADMALYHIISVFRNMTFSHLAARSLDRDQFNDAHFQLPLTSYNPRNHTLGIIGLGDIGFAIARKVHLALGMEILYYDIERKSPSQEKEVNADFYPDLNDMLRMSDCVLVATPFSGETLVTADLLTKFKPGSRLVNIARGSLVDETALANALDEGRLSGAGLDVHADEPNVNPRLANNWQVGMTSHTGGGALETWISFERLAMENVERVLTGREALTPVNSRLIKQKERDAVHANEQPSNHGGYSAMTPRSAVGGDQTMSGTLDVNGHKNSAADTGVDQATHHQTSMKGDTDDPATKELSGNMPPQTSFIGGV